MFTLRMLFAHAIALLFTATTANAVNQPLGWPGETLSGSDCHGNPRHRPSIDYRLTTPSSRNHVERRHFTPDVEQLRRGESTADILADIAYTLNVYPNHHRALWAVSRYYLGQGAKRPATNESIQRKHPPPECYFQRAMHFTPDDPMVPAIFGVYLHRLGEYDAARDMYLQAESLNSHLSEVAYNLGLLYFDLGDYEMAQKYSQKAQSLGYPLKGLEKKLQQRQQGTGASP